MTPTRPIPPDAMPVVEILRTQVSIPGRWPRTPTGHAFLRWRIWRRWSGYRGGLLVNYWCCPMGLHPRAEHPSPYCSHSFLNVDAKAVVAFAKWWDGCRDPKTACDALWEKQL